ncbi:MAG TPA: MarP family serine protease [Acidimicrobiales bacterium]|nr:MarP family serine protease [Acidimicrobiales bacterium]
MDALDVLIIVLAVAAAVGGYRLGFLARAVSWVGLAVGLYLAARFLPAIIRTLNLSDPAMRLLIAFGVLVAGALAGQAVGLLAGARLHRALPLGPVREIDRGVGAGVGALGVLVALWLLLPSIAAAPGWPARAATSSTISRWVDSTFPRAPDALQVLRRLVGPDAFPQVFNSLHPGEAVGTPPASAGISAAVDARVKSATVKVEGQACDRIQDGSGFAVAIDLVATNAHVVAGEGRGRTKVLTFAGATLPATVVLFDPDRDLALLRVPGLGESPLPRAAGHVGETGAVYGHPNGQDALALQPAQIADNVTAVGRDLYDSHETSRNVFILSSALRPGDSGAPLVNQAGAVTGVAFAIAPDRPATAYALASSELNAVLQAPVAGAVGTGPCLG